MLSQVFALAAAAALVSASPIAVRDSPFEGAGLINVVSGPKTVGCLTAAMQFTTDTTQCGTFTGTSHQECDPSFGCGGIYYTLTTSAGQCAALFQKGHQYEEGGNGVLSCSAAGATSDKTAFSLSSGVNNQIGMVLLQDSNGSSYFNTIGGKRPSATPQDFQDDLGTGAAVGTTYALTWTAA